MHIESIFNNSINAFIKLIFNELFYDITIRLFFNIKISIESLIFFVNEYLNQIFKRINDTFVIIKNNLLIIKIIQIKYINKN